METIGQRLRALRKLNKKTQEQVGDYCGVSSVSVGYWENDVNDPKSESLQLLAKFFNVTTNYILYGDDSKIEPIMPSNIKRLPLLSSIQAGSFTEHTQYKTTNETEDWIDTTYNVSSLAFALKVVGSSMLNPFGIPSIPEGAIIIVDPQVTPENGSIVVARLDGSEDATVKKLVIDGPEKYLMPLNPQYSSIKINGNCIIIGVVKGVQYTI